MFFRIKKISGKEYAYRVKNRWTEFGPRQKVVGYAGRVYRISKPVQNSNFEFKEYIEKEGLDYEKYLQELEFEKTVMDLIKWELHKHGAITNENGQLSIQNISLNLSLNSLNQNGKEIALKMNDGYLCSYTLKKIFQLGLDEDENEEPGLDFAQVLVNAGLDVPKEIFVKLYEKLS